MNNVSLGTLLTWLFGVIFVAFALAPLFIKPRCPRCRKQMKRRPLVEGSLGTGSITYKCECGYIKDTGIGYTNNA